MKKRYYLMAALSVCGCAKQADIVVYKDEFTHQNICKLENYHLFNESSLINLSWRTTYLTLKKENPFKITAILSSDIRKYPRYPVPASVTITLIYPHPLSETLNFQGYDPHTKLIRSRIDGESRTYNGFTFDLTPQQLDKINNASSVRITIPLDKPLDIQLNEEDKEAIRKFTVKCQ